jgi:hypothetical protein
MNFSKVVGTPFLAAVIVFLAGFSIGCFGPKEAIPPVFESKNLYQTKLADVGQVAELLESETLGDNARDALLSLLEARLKKGSRVPSAAVICETLIVIDADDELRTTAKPLIIQLVRDDPARDVRYYGLRHFKSFIRNDREAAQLVKAISEGDDDLLAAEAALIINESLL